MKERALLEPVELPIELTDAELDAVSGGQYSVTVRNIAFFALDIGGGAAVVTSNGAAAIGGTHAVVASGVQGLTVTL